MNNTTLRKSDIVYHIRAFPTIGTYDLDELKIRTIEETYFVGIEKHYKTAFLIPYNAINKTVFVNKKDALKKLKEIERGEMI